MNQYMLGKIRFEPETLVTFLTFMLIVLMFIFVGCQLLPEYKFLITLATFKFQFIYE